MMIFFSHFKTLGQLYIIIALLIAVVYFQSSASKSALDTALCEQTIELQNTAVISQKTAAEFENRRVAKLNEKIIKEFEQSNIYVNKIDSIIFPTDCESAFKLGVDIALNLN